MDQKLVSFCDKLHRLAETAADAILEQRIYDKMPPQRNKSIKQARLETDIFEQIISQLENKLEVNGL